MITTNTMEEWDVIPMPEYIDRSNKGLECFKWPNGDVFQEFLSEKGRPKFPIDKTHEDVLGTSTGTVVYRVVAGFSDYKRPLACKKFDTTIAGVTIKKAKDEVENMIPLKHPHIVAYVGSYRSVSDFGILMYPPARENLDEYLNWLSNILEGSSDCIPSFADGHWTNSEPRRHALKETLPHRQRLLHWFGCSAQALSYLHSDKGKKCIKHKDIKPPNFLIDKFESILLADFGIAHVQKNPNDITEEKTGKTFRYASPETLRNKGRTMGADIFSLGAVFVEMMTIAFGIPLKQLHRFRNDIACSEKKELTDDDTARRKEYANTLERLGKWLDHLKGLHWDLNDDHNEVNSLLDVIKSMLSEDAINRPKACELWQKFRILQREECATCRHEKYTWPKNVDQTSGSTLHPGYSNGESPMAQSSFLLPGGSQRQSQLDSDSSEDVTVHEDGPSSQGSISFEERQDLHEIDIVGLDRTTSMPLSRRKSSRLHSSKILILDGIDESDWKLSVKSLSFLEGKSTASINRYVTNSTYQAVRLPQQAFTSLGEDVSISSERTRRSMVIIIFASCP
jgi:serine/threonine protein kinase